MFTSEALKGLKLSELRLAVVGLGYVGLPLALAFADHFDVVGFDLDQERLNELSMGVDRTREIESSALVTTKMTYTSDVELLSDRDVIVVTVPTPINENNDPDLRLLLKACRLVGSNMKKGAVVVFESTVYPGVTEDVCVPELQRSSGLEAGLNFEFGYSPERINPGDSAHSLANVTKVVAGSNDTTSSLLCSIYSKVVDKGVFRAESIKVAETAKVLENTQRDLNIALVNELALICDKLGVDTHSVIDTAKTKWNFAEYRPGLVGGHCIGVDPYYLTYVAQNNGYAPEVILAGRRLNDSMASKIALKILQALSIKGKNLATAKVLVLGYTFKENCPDIRGTKVSQLVNELSSWGVTVDVFDPWISGENAIMTSASCKFLAGLNGGENYEAVILAVSHDVFKDDNFKLISAQLNATEMVFDLKNFLPRHWSDWRL